MVEGLRLRPAEAADAETLARLYGWHVLHGTGTFEETPPDAAEMAARLARVRAAGLPYLIAEAGGAALGYASASPYHHRSGYRFTAEDSVYVAPDHGGRGVGRALLAAVVEHCVAKGVRELLAFVGDSGNAASIALHRRLGFQDAGVLRRVGLKHGRWLDVVILQRTLAAED
jgi:L-amino acid N-acyltransferase YncA